MEVVVCCCITDDVGADVVVVGCVVVVVAAAAAAVDVVVTGVVTGVDVDAVVQPVGRHVSVSRDAVTLQYFPAHDGFGFEQLRKRERVP